MRKGFESRMKTALAIIVIVIILFIALYALRRKTVTIWGDRIHKWQVVGSFENHCSAAILMSRLNARVLHFMRHLKDKYHINETDEVVAKEGAYHFDAISASNDRYNIVRHLIAGYNPDVVTENDPRWTSDTSYTINKGEAMRLCLRSKSDPTRLVPLDVLTFVMLHELSHIATYKHWGHIDQFWITFKFILHEAVEAGIYRPVNYEFAPVTYCGLNIAYSPLYDNSLPNLWD